MFSLYLNPQLARCLSIFPQSVFCIVGFDADSGIFRDGSITGSIKTIKLTKIGLLSKLKYFYRKSNTNLLIFLYYPSQVL